MRCLLRGVSVPKDKMLFTILIVMTHLETMPLPATASSDQSRGFMAKLLKQTVVLEICVIPLCAGNSRVENGVPGVYAAFCIRALTGSCTSCRNRIMVVFAEEPWSLLVLVVCASRAAGKGMRMRVVRVKFTGCINSESGSWQSWLDERPRSGHPREHDFQSGQE
ncbi:hypothetical protein B0J13DRAFT_558637 [Dactylonectria estremocensis]|uniref:Uncharacterized protein n=1 Tax=Dactylonectria estremocensis TaxID=1079267 RepID=A0A9P9ELK8_9HYPO|nr:hypothetical protein B0J13DRAFT_558637 [Dactylonectria estremocensis]